MHSDHFSGLSWPIGVYALAHVSLPFPDDDPLLGINGQAATAPLNLSRRLVGERGVLDLSAGNLLRLRYNPFYPLVENATLAFIAQHSATVTLAGSRPQSRAQTQTHVQ